MRVVSIPRALSLLIVVVGILWSASTYAVTVLIDQFEVQRNGANFFTDTFSNNLTPSQEPGTYAVLGAFPNGAESGGQLTLNSDWGALTTNALGQVRQDLRTTFLTNMDPAFPSNGLTRANTIDVTATFSLVTPPGPLTNGYGIQIIDALLGQPLDRLVELDVQYNDNFGGDVIRFLLQDFVDGTITTLGFVPFVPPAGADQIELSISRPNTANNDFFGAYAFGTGGVFGSFSTFATPGALFTDTDFVRSRFIAFTALPEPVPEPSTLLVVASGFATWGAMVWRRRRRG